VGAIEVTDLTVGSVEKDEFKGRGYRGGRIHGQQGDK
jgi:hypothetical protein